MELLLEEHDYRRLKNLIEETYGLTLKTLGRESLSRRLLPRLLKHKMADFSEYLEFLLSSPSATEEWQEIPTLIMNTESYFFREPEQFSVFGELLGTHISAKKPSGVRVVSAGCAAGQEPYSLSVLIEREFPALKTAVEIIGMDINRAAVEKARFGLYNSYSFRGVAPEAFDGYVNSAGANMYKVSKQVANRVSFFHGNMLSAEAFCGFRNADFLFCRNVLIYMSPKATAGIVRNLWDALADHGYLFVSQSESVLDHPDLFRPVRIRDVTVYRKILP